MQFIKSPNINKTPLLCEKKSQNKVCVGKRKILNIVEKIIQPLVGESIPSSFAAVAKRQTPVNTLVIIVARIKIVVLKAFILFFYNSPYRFTSIISHQQSAFF